jgi:hypothetical protein
MSWSVSAMGKAPAVRTEIARQFTAQSKCMEPEEGVRQAARQLLDVSLAAQDAASIVKVSASGSQWTDNGRQIIRNTANVAIENMGAFLE